MGIYTAEEIWALASEPDIDFEYEHVLAMSDEEIRASLKSRGHDLRVLEAQAMIMMGLPRKATPIRAGFIGAGAAAGVSAIAASVMMAVSTHPAVLLVADNASTGTPTAVTAQSVLDLSAASAPPLTPAALREEALLACNQEQWTVCIQRLDEAKKLDPAGDDKAEVRAARDAAKRALSNGHDR